MPMEAFVIIATKGRARESRRLLLSLSKQTLKPKGVIFVGAEPADLDGLEEAPCFAELDCRLCYAARPGLTLQRNIGIERVLTDWRPAGDWFAAFFDDDFRPAADWLEQVRNIFLDDPKIMGVTGQVIADGIHGASISEDDALAYLEGRLPPGRCWAQWEEPRPISSVYGCNMAFRDVVTRDVRFDEDLPLYAWQEDRDYTGQAQAYGRVIYHPAPRGVHLGVKGGRTSGVRMGYSQIANPIFLMRKGTMQARYCWRFLWRAIAANMVKSIRNDPYVDYRGRLSGNLAAFASMMRGKLHPSRILDL
ncbi:glycosyltransferase family 2 protein [Hyphococcus sp.]|uniref:glycosyltransferase family 2 protein n=2 Tax=Hyphococcus sp. TaxID=2038636 RepID=UPI0035C685A5